MTDKDITSQCTFGDSDGESLPLTRCACGKDFPMWDKIIGTYRDLSTKCDCGRKLYFKNDVHIYEVVE